MNHYYAFPFVLYLIFNYIVTIEKNNFSHCFITKINVICYQQLYQFFRGRKYQIKLENRFLKIKYRANILYEK